MQTFRYHVPKFAELLILQSNKGKFVQVDLTEKERSIFNELHENLKVGLVPELPESTGQYTLDSNASGGQHYCKILQNAAGAKR